MSFLRMTSRLSPFLQKICLTSLQVVVGGTTEGQAAQAKAAEDKVMEGVTVESSAVVEGVLAKESVIIHATDKQSSLLDFQNFFFLFFLVSFVWTMLAFELTY